MKFSRTYKIQRILPMAGLSLGGIVLSAYALNNMPQQKIQLTDSSQKEIRSATGPLETPTVMVNGNPVSLDSSGKASVVTPEGTKVDVMSDFSNPSNAFTGSSGSGQNTSTETIHIETGSTVGGQGSTTTSSTSKVRIRDNSSSTSTSSSSTSVRSTGEGTITISN